MNDAQAGMIAGTTSATSLISTTLSVALIGGNFYTLPGPVGVCRAETPHPDGRLLVDGGFGVFAGTGRDINVFTPARHILYFQSKAIERTCYRMIDNILERFRARVKCRHWRMNNASQVAHSQHVAQMA